ncbi:Superfamily II DNA or RNA helicase, SNF2 family [Propionibacterium cyclohexanicum]|uniref:Superfamily II DNA or RNA helicase, SNF2 family n=1 Tax=Propionibacterium cyclohexanicum TaxID=64702 RepID=A0A1H9RMY1_9ACTN|nr:DEAD/DEAH box helicase [Propionibacterium cyclohexanicum]SER74170.1 Superfamily II DNA or RNA helicase, SNF2 family [Propionibacterium cyclohexanicum]
MSASPSQTPVLPGWIAALDDDTIEEHYGATAFSRGVHYSRESHRVSELSVTGQELSALVQGTRATPYRTRVFPAASGWSDECSCPVRHGCKHAVALLLVAIGTPPGLAPVRHMPAEWEQALSKAIPLAGAGGDRRLALQFDRPSGLMGFDRGSRWRIRPLRSGRDGEWLQSPVSWSDLTAPADRLSLLPGQRAAVREIAQLSHTVSSYSTSGDVFLESMPSELWDRLRRALDAGVILVHKIGEGSWAPVRLDPDPVSLAMDLISAPEGEGFQLRTVVCDVEGAHPYRPAWTLIGNPAHGVLRAGPRGALRLTAFTHSVDDSLRGLLGEASQLNLPADDVPRFLGLYAPVLRSRFGLGSSDDSVDVNHQPAPRPWMQVRFIAHDRAEVLVGVALEAAGQITRLAPGEANPTAGDELLAARTAKLRALIGNEPRARLEGRTLLNFVSNVLPGVEADGTTLVDIVGERPGYTELAGTAQLRLALTDDDSTDLDEVAYTATEEASLRRPMDWFGLDVEFTLGTHTVPVRELLGALVAGKDYLILDSGEWLDLDRTELDPLRTLLAEASTRVDPSTGTLSLNRWQLGLWQELQSSGVIVAQSARWRRSVQTLINLDAGPRPEVPSGVRARLRDYQVEGFEWLATLWDARLGGILADDMGLGKTLQTLCLVEHLKATGRLGAPALVIAPTSVMGAWHSEAAKFCPELDVAIIDKTSSKSGLSLSQAIGDAQLVITSYTLTRLDAEEFQALDWSVVVLDEAQFVKNHQAKTYTVIRELRAQMRLAITGTPLENSLMDLWSLLSIAAPGVFPDPGRFTADYVKPIESGSQPGLLEQLKRRVHPLVLRRTKGQVAAELPPKQEFLLPVTLTPEHRKIYDRQLHAERLRTMGLLDDAGKHRIEILAALTRLRQLSLHAGLVDPAHGEVASAKIDLLVEHLRSLRSEGHRALVFSQFTSFLHLVRSRLSAEEISWEYLDGRTRHREERVQDFKDGDATAFLISLKAGGFGLTLTEADYVFVLDPWWNPAAEAQAIDRTHRIGQDKQVMVYRMVCVDTIEEKVVALQEHKRELFDQVLGDEALSSGAISMDDIRSLLA